MDEAELGTLLDQDKEMSGLPSTPPPLPPSCSESKCLYLFMLMAWPGNLGAIIARIGRLLWEHRKGGAGWSQGQTSSPNAQDACAGGSSALKCAGLFSVFFLWPLAPLSSCYCRYTTEPREHVALGKALRCPPTKKV